jgi:hypothetical protein
MKLSQILEQDAQGMYHAAEGLFRMVDDLEWKPSTGTNWMSTAQLLHHCTNACGYTINGFVNGDWGLPEGVSMSDLPMEDMLPPVEKMPAVSSVDEALSILDQPTGTSAWRSCPVWWTTASPRNGARLPGGARR